MTIPYNKKLQRKEFILGILSIVLGIAFIWTEPNRAFEYAFLFVGLLHLASGIYQLKIPYLQVKNGMLKRAGLSPRSIPLSEVVGIRKFAEDYILFSSEKKLKIKSALISKHHKTELDNLMRAINVPINETPPKKYKYR